METGFKCVGVLSRVLRYKSRVVHLADIPDARNDWLTAVGVKLLTHDALDLQLPSRRLAPLLRPAPGARGERDGWQPGFRRLVRRS